jgi:ribosomal-protein-alanine N-acetyltransferase
MASLLPFATERLCVRAWSGVTGDAALRARLSAALPGILTEPVLRHLPEALRHTGPAFDPTAWMDVLLSRVDVGVVFASDGERAIGFLTIRSDDARDPEISIGYLLAEAAWGQGFATELVEGVIAACRVTGHVRLRAGVAIGNPASMHVLRKAGFRELPASEDPDTVSFVYTAEDRPA